MIERMFGVISKRSNTRLSYPKLSTVARNKEQSRDVELINISSHGLRFKSTANFKLGDKLWFDIRSNEEKPLLSLCIKGQIINDYTNTGDIMHDYGVQFYRLRYLNEIERIHSYVHKNKNSEMPPPAINKIR